VSTAGPQGGRGGPGRIVYRALFWPLRRFFDTRFTSVQNSLAAHASAEARDTRDHLQAVARDMHEIASREEEARLESLRRFVVSSRDANVDAATFVGETLRDLDERLTDLHEALERRPSADELDEQAAEFLNRALGHEGFAAKRGLWFNWPLTLAYGPSEVRVASVNERIVEVPYALRACAQLAPGARVLDVGAAESTLALSLAALGFRVVALDPRGYPLEHANLRAIESPLESWDTDERFDAATCVSTIEHLGQGEYGQSRRASGAETRAFERLRELLDPGGLLVLTAPLGGSGYERERLDELLEGWQVEDFAVAEQRGPTEWAPAEGEPTGNAVALVTARRA
jgi:hypothetical protein